MPSANRVETKENSMEEDYLWVDFLGNKICENCTYECMKEGLMIVKVIECEEHKTKLV